MHLIFKLYHTLLLGHPLHKIIIAYQIYECIMFPPQNNTKQQVISQFRKTTHLHLSIDKDSRKFRDKKIK